MTNLYRRNFVLLLVVLMVFQLIMITPQAEARTKVRFSKKTIVLERNHTKIVKLLGIKTKAIKSIMVDKRRANRYTVQQKSLKGYNCYRIKGKKLGKCRFILYIKPKKGSVKKCTLTIKIVKKGKKPTSNRHKPKTKSGTIKFSKSNIKLKHGKSKIIRLKGIRTSQIKAIKCKKRNSKCFKLYRKIKKGYMYIKIQGKKKGKGSFTVSIKRKKGKQVKRTVRIRVF